MGAWLSNISLKYKFWAVNAVAFVTTLLLVLYAVHLEQHARAARRPAARPGRCWPPGPPGKHCRPANVITWSADKRQFAGEALEACAMPRAGSSCPAPGSR
jgi:hypothetical protein